MSSWGSTPCGGIALQLSPFPSSISVSAGRAQEDAGRLLRQSPASSRVDLASPFVSHGGVSLFWVNRARQGGRHCRGAEDRDNVICLLFCHDSISCLRRGRRLAGLVICLDGNVGDREDLLLCISRRPVTALSRGQDEAAGLGRTLGRQGPAVFSTHHKSKYDARLQRCNPVSPTTER